MYFHFVVAIQEYAEGLVQEKPEVVQFVKPKVNELAQKYVFFCYIKSDSMKRKKVFLTIYIYFMYLIFNIPLSFPAASMI